MSIKPETEDDEQREYKLGEILHGVLHSIIQSHDSLWELCTSVNNPLFSIEENKKKAIFYFFRNSRKLLIFAYILTKWANSNVQKRSSGFSILNNPSDKPKTNQINDILSKMRPFSGAIFPQMSHSLLSNSDLNLAIDFLSNPTFHIISDDNFVPQEKRMKLTQEEIDDVSGFVERTIQWKLFYNTKFPQNTFNKIKLDHGILTLVVDDEYMLHVSVTGPSAKVDRWMLVGMKYLIKDYVCDKKQEDMEFEEIKKILSDKENEDDVFNRAHKKLSKSHIFLP